MRTGLQWHDMEQGTPEWHAIRAGKVTGTDASALLASGGLPENAQKIVTAFGKRLANEKKRKEPNAIMIGRLNTAVRYIKERNPTLGAAAWTVIYRAAAEILTGETETPEFDTFATLRGKNMEGLAIQEYESETFRSANRIGFVQWGDFAGASPDFMVDEERGGEVKCLLAPGHLRYCHTREIEKAHFAQVQWALFVTGFQVWDLVHFHPKAGKMRLVIDEIRPDYEMHGVFSERLSLIAERIGRVVAMCQEEILI